MPTEVRSQRLDVRSQKLGAGQSRIQKLETRIRNSGLGALPQRHQDTKAPREPGEVRSQKLEARSPKFGHGQVRIQKPETRMQNCPIGHPERAQRVEWVSPEMRDVPTTLDMTAARRSL